MRDFPYLPPYVLASELAEDRPVLDFHPGAGAVDAFESLGLRGVVVLRRGTRLAGGGTESVSIVHANGEGLPLGTGSVAVVLAASFPLLDPDERDGFLAEARRVVGPDGFLLATLPSGAVPMLLAPPAERGVDPAELQRAVRRHFPHIALVAQTPFLGYHLRRLAYVGAPGDLVLSTALADEEEEAVALLAVCSARYQRFDANHIVQLRYSPFDETVRARIDELADLTEASRREARRSQEGFEKLRADVATLTDRAREADRLEREITSARSTAHEAEAELKDLRARALFLDRNLAAAAGGRQGAIRRASEAEDTVRDLSTALTKERRRAEAALAALDGVQREIRDQAERLSRVQRALDDREEALALARDERDRLGREKVKAERRAAEVEAALEAARRTAADADASVRALGDETEALRQRVHEAERARQMAADRNDDAVARLRALEEDLRRAQAAAERRREEVDSARAEAEAARRDAASAQKELEAARAEADAARRGAGSAHTEAEAARAEMEAAFVEAEAARAAAEAARAEAEAARTDAEASRTGLGAAGAEVDAARAEAKVARADADRARSEAEAARAEADHARSELDVARTALDVARAELDVARAEAGQASSELDAARAELDLARAATGQARADLDEARRAHAEALHARGEAGGKREQELLASLEARDELVRDLRASLEARGASAARLDEEREVLKRQLSEARRGVVDAEARADAAEEAVRSFKERVEELDGVRAERDANAELLDDARGRLDELEAEGARRDESVANLEGMVQGLRHEAREAGKVIGALHAEKEKLMALLSEKEDLVGELQGRLDDVRKGSDEGTGDIERLEKELADARSRIEAADREIASMREVFEWQAASWQGEREQIEQAIGARSAEVTALQRELAGAREAAKRFQDRATQIAREAARKEQAARKESRETAAAPPTEAGAEDAKELRTRLAEEKGRAAEAIAETVRMEAALEDLSDALSHAGRFRRVVTRLLAATPLASLLIESETTRRLEDEKTQVQSRLDLLDEPGDVEPGTKKKA